MPSPLQKAFHSLLVASTNVTDIVGEKIRPDQMKKTDKPPGIYIEVIEDTAVDDLEGDSEAGTATVQVVCQAHTRDAAADLGIAARAALNNFRGTQDGVVFQEITYTGVNRNYEPPLDGGDEQPWFFEVPMFFVFQGTGGPS